MNMDQMMEETKTIKLDQARQLDDMLAKYEVTAHADQPVVGSGPTPPATAAATAAERRRPNRPWQKPKAAPSASSRPSSAAAPARAGADGSADWSEF